MCIFLLYMLLCIINIIIMIILDLCPFTPLVTGTSEQYKFIQSFKILDIPQDLDKNNKKIKKPDRIYFSKPSLNKMLS